MRRLHLIALALSIPAHALAQAPAPSPPAAPPAAAAPRPDPSALLAEVDREWPGRDAPGAIDRIRGRLAEAEKLAPDDYGVLWRQARLYFWLADDPTLAKGEKSRLGKVSWEYGDRASRAAPDRVEGWNYAAAGMGNYALGIGIFTALRQGIEGKFKERLGKATRIKMNLGTLARIGFIVQRQDEIHEGPLLDLLLDYHQLAGRVIDGALSDLLGRHLADLKPAPEPEWDEEELEEADV